MPATTAQLAWLGSTQTGLGWLNAQMHARAGARAGEGPKFHVRNYAPDATSDEALLRACRSAFATTDDAAMMSVETGRGEACNLARVVLACETRIDYPLRTVEWLQRHLPEVPVAIALGSWWDGSGRTGLRNKAQLAIAWHRWWDSWIRWIDGSDTAILTHAPATHAHLGFAAHEASVMGTLPEQISSAQTTEPRVAPGKKQLGMIVANCRLTGESWRLSADVLGYPAQSLTLAEWRQPPATPASSSPRWILWDDTCLDTFGNLREPETVLGMCREIRDQHPDGLLIVAVSLPRWETVTAAEQGGACGLLVKPSAGTGLATLLAEKLTRESQPRDRSL